MVAAACTDWGAGRSPHPVTAAEYWASSRYRGSSPVKISRWETAMFPPRTRPVPASDPPLVPRSPLTMSHCHALAEMVHDPDTFAVRLPLTCTAYMDWVSFRVIRRNA